MSDPSHEMKRALANFRDRQFADLVTLVIGLAARTHPEELRAAIASVFDLKAVEETTQRMMITLSNAQAEVRSIAAEVHSLTDQIHLDVDQLEQRIDALQHDLEQLRRRVPARSPVPD